MSLWKHCICLQEEEQDLGGMRGDSRVGKLLNEFGGKDDWVSKTVLKHQMATILQVGTYSCYLVDLPCKAYHVHHTAAK